MNYAFPHLLALSPAKRSIATALALLLYCSTLPAQIIPCVKRGFSESWQNAKQLPGEVSRASGRQLMLAGMGAATLGFTMAYDAPLQKSWQLSPNRGTRVFSQVGEPFGHPLKVGSVLALGYIAACHWEHEALRSAGSAALQSVVVGVALSYSLKLLTQRVRPIDQSLLNPYDFRGPQTALRHRSFPSAHATTAFAVAASLSRSFDDKWYLALSLYGWAGLTAWQRVQTAQHWPSDVLAGALIGTLVGRAMAGLQEKSSRVGWGSGASVEGYPLLRFSLSLAD